MADKTGISWTDATWNPTKGCEQVSPGCRNCYAKHQAARIVRMSKGKPSKYDGLVKIGPKGDPCWTGEGAFDAETLALPLRWRAPRRIFVDSMSDLFFEKFSNEQIAAVFGVMAAAPQHTFQILTKRAQRMREWFEWARGRFTDDQRGIASAPHTFRAMLDAAYEILGKPSKAALDAAWHANEDDVWPLRNVWIGVSVENQDAHDERAEDLLACPAAVYFFSVEPMLGAIDAGQSLRRMLRTLDGRLLRNDHPDARSVSGTWRRPIDWVIAGCESGPGARPCSVEWLRSLRDQCAGAGVPYFLKQATPSMGSLAYDAPKPAPIDLGGGSKWKQGAVIELPYLDGVQHAAFPEAR